MKTVTLKILANDIRNSDYLSLSDCAVVRALKRENLDIYEYGVDTYTYNGRTIDITGLDNRVRAMYKFLHPQRKWGLIEAIEPKDFEYELVLEP